ncbi:MAG: DUF484 family protein [Rhodospirillaceae bacterium]|nr:DUF484 family protein [Rhodospirillaceae bacterium]
MGTDIKGHKHPIPQWGDDEIGEYLLEHPDFFSRNPDILVNMATPGRYEQTPGGVVDFQQVMLDRLKGEIENLTACTQDVIETSRTNMSYQTRTHAAVLALLSASDALTLARIIIDDLPLLLDVDVVAYGFERDSLARPQLLALPGVHAYSKGYVDSCLGEGVEVQLMRDVLDDGTIFGEAASLVNSAGIARIRQGASTPNGLFALGSRTNGAFNSGQGTELLNFLARVVEKMFHRCLETPDQATNS